MAGSTRTEDTGSAAKKAKPPASSTSVPSTGTSSSARTNNNTNNNDINPSANISIAPNTRNSLPGVATVSSAQFFGDNTSAQITPRSNSNRNGGVSRTAEESGVKAGIEAMKVPPPGRSKPRAAAPVTARKCPQTGVDDNDGYLVKSIQFGYLPVRIVTQEGDGPCSLIAIANCLLLRGTISLPDGDMWISHAHLLRILRDYALNVNRVPAGASDEVRANVHANMRAGLKVLFSPTMRKGMMCNPTLTNATSFEFTPEIGLFDLFRIRPVHGWVVEPEDSPCIHEFFKGRSYNQVQDAISHLLCGDIDDTPYQPHPDVNSAQGIDQVDTIEAVGNADSNVDRIEAAGNDSGDVDTIEPVSNGGVEVDAIEPVGKDGGEVDTIEPAGSNGDDVDAIKPAGRPIQRSKKEGTADQASLASAWLLQHSTQMTETGVVELEKNVRKNEIAVLFRNNHFSTVIKHDDGKLYTLMSATAFLEFPAYVWQLVAVHGRDFGVFNGSFIPLEQ